jgi:hypothetical protein
MNIKQLKEKIKDLPDHMDVVIQRENTEFPMSLAETGKVVKASFSEEPNGKVLAKDKVFIISDEA